MGQESTRWAARLGQQLPAAVSLVPVLASVAAAWTVNHLLPPAAGRIEQPRNLLLVPGVPPGPAEHLGG
jgi:hypothetical protein